VVVGTLTLAVAFFMRNSAIIDWIAEEF
jgi:hypothetical protein